MLKITGLDKLQRQLRDLSNRARALDGTHQVPFDELFSPDFMQRHSSHADFESLLKAGGYEVNSQEDFEAIPDEEWEEHIRRHTQFSSWQEMQETAAGAWMTKKLGL